MAISISYSEQQDLCKKGYKECSSCNHVKVLEDFPLLKRGLYGRNSLCKECSNKRHRKYAQRHPERIKKSNRKYREKYAEDILEYNKQYRRNNPSFQKRCTAAQKAYWDQNKEDIKERRRRSAEELGHPSKRYYQRNREKMCQKALEWRRRPATYPGYTDRLSHLKPHMEGGFLKVPCYKCGVYFTPINQDVQSHIRAYYGRIGAENNLYCSEHCKQACEVYGRQPHASLCKDVSSAVRACQTDHLKQLQCDEYGHNYCEKCGDIIDVELHHTLPVATGGRSSINSAGHILLCTHCHNMVTC